MLCFNFVSLNMFRSAAHSCLPNDRIEENKGRILQDVLSGVGEYRDTKQQDRFHVFF